MDNGQWYPVMVTKADTKETITCLGANTNTGIVWDPLQNKHIALTDIIFSKPTSFWPKNHNGGKLGVKLGTLIHQYKP